MIGATISHYGISHYRITEKLSEGGMAWSARLKTRIVAAPLR